MTSWQAALTIAGLAVITLVTRAFFLIPKRELPLPGWLVRGLRHAPIAALAAVVVPEVLLTQGQLIATWHDARPYAAAAGAAWFFWRGGMLGTIVVGSAVLLVLRFGLGW